MKWILDNFSIACITILGQQWINIQYHPVSKSHSHVISHQLSLLFKLRTNDHKVPSIISFFS